jgi:hypothetical protein
VTTFRACFSPAPTPVKPQPAPAILSQESVHTTLSITHHTRKRPSTGPRTTHGPQCQIKSRNLGKKQEGILICCMSTQIQIKFLEIPHFENKPILRMLQNSPLTRISSPRLKSYLRFEEMRVFLPQGRLLLPCCFALGVITSEHLAEARGGVPG